MRTALAGASQRKEYYSAHLQRAFDTRRQMADLRSKEQVRAAIMSHIKDLQEQEQELLNLENEVPEMRATITRLKKELGESNAQLTRVENEKARSDVKVKTPDMKFNSARVSISKEEIKLLVTKPTLDDKPSHSKKTSVAKIDLPAKKVSIL